MERVPLPRAGFLNLGTGDILGQIIVWYGPVHCRVLCSTPGIYHEMPITYPLPTVRTKNISDIAKCPQEAKLSCYKLRA